MEQPAHGIDIVTNLLVILTSATVVALVLQRVRLAVIPAYMITGALIGPSALRFVESPEGLEGISHLAILLLLFGIGLELHLSALRHRIVRSIIAGLGSCGATVAILWPIIMAFGPRAPEALAISMGLSLSSTAVVLRTLSARRELLRTSGRLSVAILVIQDLLVLGMLGLLPFLALWTQIGEGQTAAEVGGPELGWVAFATKVVIRLIGIGCVIALGRILLPRLLQESLRGGSLEVMMIAGIAVSLATAYLTQLIGFSLEMGAFLAGFVLAGSPFRHQLLGQIGPLRDLFIAVFFTTLGMSLDLAVALEYWWVVLIGGAIVTGLKMILIAGSCWAVGTTAATAVAVGFSLAQAGEFSLVLFDAAQRNGVLTNEVTAIVTAIVVLSLIQAPAFVGLGSHFRKIVSHIGVAPWIHSAYTETGTAPHPNEKIERDTRQHVVIGGYGPIGQRLAMELELAGASGTIIELNPATVKRLREEGKSSVFGDIANPEVLERAGIGKATALVLTVPDDEAVFRASTMAHLLNPEVFVVVRIGLLSKREMAEKCGANHVTVDEMAAAESMLEAVMDRLD